MTKFAEHYAQAAQAKKPTSRLKILQGALAGAAIGGGVGGVAGHKATQHEMYFNPDKRQTFQRLHVANKVPLPVRIKNPEHRLLTKGTVLGSGAGILGGGLMGAGIAALR